MDARERLAARLPASFQKGRTAEAKAAYESGSLEEWEALVPKLRAEVQKVRAKIPAFHKPLGPEGLTSRSLGEPAQLPAASFLKGPEPRPRQTTGDADRDGLPETLEEGLWQAFAPRYFISAAEPNRFAFFANGAQAVVTRTQVAPVGYYRVLPLFLGTRSGVTYGFAQITYATLAPLERAGSALSRLPLRGSASRRRQRSGSRSAGPRSTGPRPAGPRSDSAGAVTGSSRTRS